MLTLVSRNLCVLKRNDGKQYPKLEHQMPGQHFFSRFLAIRSSRVALAYRIHN